MVRSQLRACDTAEHRSLLKLSVEEAGPAFVGEGLITSDELERTLADMQTAIEDSKVIVLAPRMSLVWARKALIANSNLPAGCQ